MKTIVTTGLDHGYRCYRVWSSEPQGEREETIRVFEGVPYYLVSSNKKEKWAWGVIFNTFPFLRDRSCSTMSTSFIYCTDDPDVRIFSERTRKLEKALRKHQQGEAQFESVTPGVTKGK